MNTFKIEQKILKIQNPIFIKNYWSNELKLIELTINGKVFTYNHLENFFSYSFDQAFKEIKTSIEHNTVSEFRPIRFFFEAIHSKSNIDLFSLIKNHELLNALSASEKLNLNVHHQNDRFKIKSNYESINLFLNNLSSCQKVNCIFDFTQNLTIEQFYEIHQKIINHPNINLIYYEDPLNEYDLAKLSKEYFKLIALDELLHPKSEFLKYVQWIVLKPAIIEESDLEFYFSLNKKINLSSCYEAPSQHSSYLKFLEKTNNDYHGIFKSLPK